MHMYKTDKGKELRNSILFLYIYIYKIDKGEELIHYLFSIYIKGVVRASQTSKMELFAKTFARLKLLTIFSKSSIVDV